MGSTRGRAVRAPCGRSLNCGDVIGTLKGMRPPLHRLRAGIIGTGFMGKAHAFAYRAALAAFPDIPVPRLEMIADVNEGLAAKAAHQYGFARASGDWRALVNDPRIDVVSITTPNTLHKEMALAAIAHGKHVHCEKPLSPTLADSLAMVEAAVAVSP